MESVINDLKELVLNERQAKAYYAILKNNQLTITDIQKATGLVRNKVYDTIKFLTGNGFCTKRMNDNNITYSAVHPKVPFQKIIENKESNLNRTKDLLGKLIEIHQSKPLQGDMLDYLEIVHGNLNVHKRFIELLNGTMHTVLSISCPPYAISSKKEDREQNQATKKFFERGGVDISIREENEDSPGFTFHSIRKTLKNYKPENNRITKKSPIKLFIFDNKTLMTFNSTFIGSGDEICASIIKQPNTVSTYIHMFNYLFEQAESFESWMASNQDLYERKLQEYDELSYQ